MIICLDLPGSLLCSLSEEYLSHGNVQPEWKPTVGYNISLCNFMHHKYHKYFLSNMCLVLINQFFVESSMDLTAPWVHGSWFIDSMSQILWNFLCNSGCNVACPKKSLDLFQHIESQVVKPSQANLFKYPYHDHYC